MQHQQLNRLALQAKSGCDDSMWKIKLLFLKMIQDISERERNHIKSQCAFEDDCFKVIEDAVKRVDFERGDIASLIRRSILRRLTQHRDRYRVYQRGHVVHPMPTYKDGEDEQFDIADDLAIVEDEVELNEKVALLAEGDSRRLVVLNAWKRGCYNDSDIALFLAKQLGGKSASHLKFISRFKTSCRTTLVDAV